MLQGCLLHLLSRRAQHQHLRLLLHLLLQMHFTVSLFLVGASELPAARVTREGFLSGVCAHVGRQVVGAREGAHADAALERLLSGVYADVAGELVRAAEPSVAFLDGACVRALVRWRFARAVRVLPGLHREEFELSW